MIRIVLLTAVVLTISAFAITARAQDAPPQGDATAGRALYLKTGCFYCHGRAGQGGAYNREAPALAKTAMPFVGFKFQLRSPGGDMPAYVEAVIGDKDVADIYAFLQSPPPPPRPQPHPRH